MDKLRKIFVAAMICLVVSTIAVYAITTFTRTFTWTMASKTFEVYDTAPPFGSALPSSGSVPIPQPVSYSDVKTYTYWVNNTGNVALTIQVIENTETTCSGSWDKNNTAIAKGSYDNFTLSLTDFQNGGQYIFIFSIAP